MLLRDNNNFQCFRLFFNHHRIFRLHHSHPYNKIIKIIIIIVIICIYYVCSKTWLGFLTSPISERKPVDFNTRAYYTAPPATIGCTPLATRTVFNVHNIILFFNRYSLNYSFRIALHHIYMYASRLPAAFNNNNINVFRPSLLSLNLSSRLQKSKNRVIVVEKPRHYQQLGRYNCYYAQLFTVCKIPVPVLLSPFSLLLLLLRKIMWSVWVL